ncbi:elongation factor EF-2, partial [archaeon]|nr:elongation factor EF-2 [archaeon]
VAYLDEIRDTIITAFNWAVSEGPLAGEIVRGVKVVLHDAKVHEDPVHRGPAQIMPATRHAMFAAILSAEPLLLEPMLRLEVKVPAELVGSVTKIISHKRGRVLNIQHAEYVTVVTGEIPAAESFDLADVLRSATSGRAFWGTSFSRWQPVPKNMQEQIIAQIRKRKGLPPEPPKPEDFLGP